ncbi:glycogen debranching protein GlgX [Conservatibacter flavescens]|uniref:Glycogen debranching enzyme GlgX n=1 Tax=Conservatibacter flavescens TaxID=28161 RepID=A0A2M8S5G7_9PAST|nr:glycogen debranching protein GlgX [Conservatibacter flavescens]PJG86377.1 glycogen debranching enzyme GlgX [Conservatibacter flavescens]
MKFEFTEGVAFPLGYSIQNHQERQGINFSLFSTQAQAVDLCLFIQEEELRFPLYRTDNYWHIWIQDLPLNTAYGFRVYGEGSNPQKLLLDPYAKGVMGKPDCSTAEKQAWFSLQDERDNAEIAPKSVVMDLSFDWQDDKPLQTPWANTIIYELHVKGFTQLREDLPENMRGTYAGLAHPTTIAYLKELGISAVELLPVFYHLDEIHLQQLGLKNYWGYNPVTMFAVEADYWSGEPGTTPLTEFKSMVKALHQAGIEVILDVVFNHTAESEKHHPTYCHRGIDEHQYYWHDEQGHYVNWTGCGNMLNIANENGRRWVIDCLKYWVEECHVDGFRFDLGTNLGREPYFNPQAQLFADIAQESSLQGCKFIAEPWDIGEYGYQLGQFPPYFAEWNDRYRDDMCRFWLWKSGELGAFADRLAGSSDIFGANRLPHHSINFITAHDGFTLRDLVSYNQKHNEANGEQNRDGRNENYSYNHGIEGIENIPSAVENQRFFSSVSLLQTLLLSNGTPMLLAGDEFGNTQYGNNNAYCQDNEIAWLDWQNQNEKLLFLTKQTIALRKKIQSLQTDKWWSSDNVTWLSVQGKLMETADWQNYYTKALQVQLDQQWLLLINGKDQEQEFHLPPGSWREYCESKYHNVINGYYMFKGVGVRILCQAMA